MRQASYKALAVELRRRILGGEIASGDRIPTEMELARRHGVSRTTARLAVKELEKESLVYRRQGSGTFASGGRSAPTFAGSSFTSYLKSLEGSVKRTILDLKWIEPSDELATTLRIPKTSAMLWFVRLDQLDGEPMGFDEAWIAGPYAHRLGRDDLERLDFFEEWQRKQNFRPTRGTLELAAAPADDKQGELLEVPKGSPLLIEFSDMFVEEEGVARFRTWYRHDKYRYKKILHYNQD